MYDLVGTLIKVLMFAHFAQENAAIIKSLLATAPEISDKYRVLGRPRQRQSDDVGGHTPQLAVYVLNNA